MSIDLDHNATTRPRPEVIEAVARALEALPGNPSSTHAAGRAARAAIEDARAEVAALLGATPEEIVFTSGGTEANTLGITGLLEAARERRDRETAGPGQALEPLHVVCSPLEHPSVLGVIEAAGARLTLVDVGSDGSISLDALRQALRPGITALVSLALGNHEIGNVYPIAELAAAARVAGAAFHCDAVAACGKIPIDVGALGVDALSISAHKLHGPKGVGALYVRRGAAFSPVVTGGHQERERRPGTENVSGIVGFSVAARLAARDLAGDAGRISSLRARLEQKLLAIAGARRHGPAHTDRRLPGTLNVAFAGVPGQRITAALDADGVQASTGAACTSGSLAPSPVILALGLSPAAAAEAVRFGIGRDNDAEEIDRAAALVSEIVARIRAGGERPRWQTPETPTGLGTFPSRRSRERIVVAMSGGVDSSTAAALLVEAGYEVIGATLRLYDASGTAASIGGRCCGPRDIEDARLTASSLGIAHHVIDESAAFRDQVIDDFVAEHRAGRTPNPCVRCNERLKFGPLLAFADAVGASALATGHYARLQSGPNGPTLLRAVDRDKDQSYFLFGVRPEVLTRVRFPLGDLTKTEVRALARRHRLPNADKPDSQQICFIPDGDHIAFVAARGGAGPAGAIIDDASGAPLGAHDGTHAFTVGQRRGVPAGPAGERRFVLRIDGATGEVRVGPRARLGQEVLEVGDVRWLRAAGEGAGAAPSPFRCTVQIRHHATAAPAWVEPTEGRVARVRLEQPAFGVAPGQAAVFYDRDEAVIGGGWIRAERLGGAAGADAR